MGGSNAAQILNCPGSIALLATLPKAINTTSEWAEKGTDLHGYLSTLIDQDMRPMIGDMAGDTEITEAVMHDLIEPCMDYWRALKNVIDEYVVEAEGPFTGVPGAFGTCDLGARSEVTNTTYVTDWKTGAGESVVAEYEEEDDNGVIYLVVNEQLLFYACCLRVLYPEWFPQGVMIVLTIVQPLNQDPAKRITHATVDNATLDDFEAEVKAALRTASRPEAPQKIGHWCRFAACKPVCKLHSAPLLDLAALETATMKAAPRKTETAHTDALARILELAPIAEAVIAEARQQAHDLLTAGHPVRGFKLVPKRAIRRWNAEDAEIIKALRRRYRLKKSEVTELVLKSPAQVEKLLARGETIPTSLAAGVSSGATLAQESDKRPAVIAEHVPLVDVLQLALAHAEKGE